MRCAISSRGEQLPRRELLAVAPQRVVADLDDVAVVHRLHHRAADRVEQRHVRGHDPFRPAVRVAARDRVVGVHDRDHARREQALGRDAIEVAVVDDRDLAPPDPRGEILGADARPGRRR